MSVTTANGRAETAAAVSSTPPIAITQAINNVAWPSGGAPITSAPFTLGGNPVLVSASMSGWTASPGAPLQAQIELTPPPAQGIGAGNPALCINPGSMHQTFVRSWALVDAPASTGATITAAGGTNINVDTNDTSCVTVYELGPGAPLAVRVATGPAPPPIPLVVQSGVMLYQPFVSFGGRLLIRVAASGMPPANQTQVSLAIDLDGEEIARTECLGLQNTGGNTNWHFTTVPVDVLVDAAPGPHALVVRSSGGSQFDAHDQVSALVLEEMGPAGALQIQPILVNAPCITQTGGGTAAWASFGSGGGTLVICASASGYAKDQTTSYELGLGFVLDGQPLKIGQQQALLQVLANMPNGWSGAMHLAMVSNDLVVPDIPGGSHVLELVANANTFTDGDDRCSITVLELAPAA
jgi:hypothetical protein